MFNFFVKEENRAEDRFYIDGSDFNHIKNVLRMKNGEELLVSCDGISNLCRLVSTDGECAVAEIIEEDYRNTELDIKIYLFQGLPKSDKMELIIQKAVELGVYEIIPVQMNRCVVKLDEKKKKSKIQRWQAISESAAKQSKRNTVPLISDVLTYNEAIKKAKDLDLILVPYENARGMLATKEALCEIKNGSSVGIIIGPEGGFEESEVLAAENTGGRRISLGDRILRTETAAITAVGMCMLYAQMNLNGEKE